MALKLALIFICVCALTNGQFWGNDMDFPDVPDISDNPFLFSTFSPAQRMINPWNQQRRMNAFNVNQNQIGRVSTNFVRRQNIQPVQNNFRLLNSQQTRLQTRFPSQTNSFRTGGLVNNRPFNTRAISNNRIFSIPRRTQTTNSRFNLPAQRPVVRQNNGNDLLFQRRFQMGFHQNTFGKSSI